MKKSDLKLLRERNQKAVAPSPKKEDLSDELSKLFDDGTTLEKSAVVESPTPRPTSAHLTSDHPGSPQTTPKRKKLPTAPERDFNRRANSLERDAIPAGLFPGASKKLYDALYLRTRGAHKPTRTIQATRTELMKWAGIGSRNTFLNHMRHFLKVGLLIRHFEIGDNDGAAYEVCIPEEIDLSNLGSPRLTSAQPTSARLTSTQEVGGGSDQNVIRRDPGQTTENISASDSSKTSFKTSEQNLDDEAAAAVCREFANELAQALSSREATRADYSGMRELFDVILTEARIARDRTSVVSSPSAFVAEHLRRRLFKKSKREMESETKAATPTAPSVDASKCLDCGGSSWWYPNGPDKGVARCKHARLTQGKEKS
jgi:hypothetical protein